MTRRATNVLNALYICGMRNDIRMAVESIAGNMLTLETALTAAVQYERKHLLRRLQECTR
jgi:hypothetical protein